MHFTSPRADKDVVVQLYARIFPKLTQHEEILVHKWEAGQVRELLEVLPRFEGLQKVTVRKFTFTEGSGEALAQLHEALAARGGALLLGGRVEDWDDSDVRGLLEALRLGARFKGDVVTICNGNSSKELSEAVLLELRDAVRGAGAESLHYLAPATVVFPRGRPGSDGPSLPAKGGPGDS